MRKLKILCCGLSVTVPACDSAPPRVHPEWATATFGDGIEWVLADTAGGDRMIPALHGDRVYFAGRSNVGGSFTTRLLAVDPETGKARWTGFMGVANNSAATSDHIAALSGSLAVFRRSDGTKLQQWTPPSANLSGYVSADAAHFYVLTHNSGRAIAYNPVTNTVLWDTPLGTGPNLHGGGTLVSGGRLLVTLWRLMPDGKDSSIVASLDLATGAIQWRVALDVRQGGEIVVVPPVVMGDKVYAVTYRHSVYALALSTGARAWMVSKTSATSEIVSGGIAACDGRIIVPTGDLGLVALDGNTGADVWSVAHVQDGSLHSVQCIFGTVLTNASWLHVYSASNGALLSRYPRDELVGTVITGATRDATSLYVQTDEGFVKLRAP